MPIRFTLFKNLLIQQINPGQVNQKANKRINQKIKRYALADTFDITGPAVSKHNPTLAYENNESTHNS